MKIPLLGPSYRARSLPFSSQRTINFYTDVAQAEARDQAVMHHTPGIAAWIDIGGSVGCRGAVYQDGRLYAVIATTLYAILADGTYSNIGTIGGTDRLSMASNGTQICIVSRQAGAFIYSLGGSLQQITDADFYPSEKVVFLDQYFVHLRQSSQIFFLSALANGLAYDALDFASAESNPDLLVSIESDNGEIWLFGENNTEVWTNTGSNDFPFALINGAVMQKGIACRDAVARIDNSVYWLGNDGVVYRATGYQPQAISTNAIDSQIAQLEWDDAFALTYSQEGHNFFILTFPTSGQTFVYDATVNSWHERSSRINNTDIQWRPSHLVDAFGHLVAFDQFSGKVGYVEMDTYKEYGNTIVRTRITPVVHAETKPLFMSRLEIVAETGIGDGTITPTVIGCAYPMDATEAEILALGLDGKLTMSNSEQTGTYTIQGGLASSETFAAGSLTAIDYTTGIKATEHIFSLPTITGGDGLSGVIATASLDENPFSGSAPVRVKAVAVNDGTFLASVMVDNSTVWSGPCAATGRFTIIADGSTGALTVKLDGVELTLSDPVYTVQDALLTCSVEEPAGINPLYAGTTASWTLVTNASDLTYAEGAGTVCGQSVDAPPVTYEADTSDGNPMLLLSYSDDGGRTFSDEREESMGRMGEYRTRIRFHRLGRFYQRVMRIRVSAGVRIAIISADAEIEVGRA